MSEIRRLREAKGYSRDQLAGSAGISAKTLARYEAGERDVPARVLRAISSELGCSMDDLMSEPPEGSENPTPPRRRETLPEAGAKAAA